MKEFTDAEIRLLYVQELNNTLDWKKLEARILTKRHLEILRKDDRYPRWDLDPPQREEYNDPVSYMKGLAEYADRIAASEKEKRHGKSDRRNQGR